MFSGVSLIKRCGSIENKSKCEGNEAYRIEMQINMNDSYLILLIGLVAFLYSSVGHGGASGYLALLTIWGIDPEMTRSSALVLNIFVSGIAFLSYSKVEQNGIRKTLPFLLGSVPAAFAGSLIKTDIHDYKLILSFVLLMAVFRMLIRVRSFKYEVIEIPRVWATVAGIGIGFVSGLIGIGGGILLSPLLIFLRWASIKETACMSAFFILINSTTALNGLLLQGYSFNWVLVPLSGAAVLGALFGSWLGSRYLPVPTLKLTLAIVLIFASFKLFYS